MTSLDRANAARLDNALDKLYRYGDEGIMPLREYLRRHPPTHKTTCTQVYSDHRINLEYKKLAQPRIFYTVYTGDTGICVPKIVWDSLDVPTKEQRQ